MNILDIRSSHEGLGCTLVREGLCVSLLSKMHNLTNTCKITNDNSRSIAKVVVSKALDILLTKTNHLMVRSALLTGNTRGVTEHQYTNRSGNTPGILWHWHCVEFSFLSRSAGRCFGWLNIDKSYYECDALQVRMTHRNELVRRKFNDCRKGGRTIDCLSAWQEESTSYSILEGIEST
uniref:SFRICE_022554 n=1 Tax=Spodoptera frugiperda TaxID=7108 RepID=A0A2H1WYG3_SPOFR